MLSLACPVQFSGELEGKLEFSHVLRGYLQLTKYETVKFAEKTSHEVCMNENL